MVCMYMHLCMCLHPSVHMYSAGPKVAVLDCTTLKQILAKGEGVWQDSR